MADTPRTPVLRDGDRVRVRFFGRDFDATVINWKNWPYSDTIMDPIVDLGDGRIEGLDARLISAILPYTGPKRPAVNYFVTNGDDPEDIWVEKEGRGVIKGQLVQLAALYLRNVKNIPLMYRLDSAALTALFDKDRPGLIRKYDKGVIVSVKKKQFRRWIEKNASRICETSTKLRKDKHTGLHLTVRLDHPKALIECVRRQEVLMHSQTGIEGVVIDQEHAMRQEMRMELQPGGNKGWEGYLMVKSESLATPYLRAPETGLKLVKEPVTELDYWRALYGIGHELHWMVEDKDFIGSTELQEHKQLSCWLLLQIADRFGVILPEEYPFYEPELPKGKEYFRDWYARLDEEERSITATRELSAATAR